MPFSYTEARRRIFRVAPWVNLASVAERSLIPELCGGCRRI